MGTDPRRPSASRAAVPSRARRKRIGGTAALALTLAAMLPALAPAAQSVVTGTVAPGRLSLGTGAPADVHSPRSDTTVLSVPLRVTDARGTGEGWHVTVAQETLGADALPVSVVGASERCLAGSCTAPVNVVAYPSELSPGGPAADVFSARPGSGQGSFAITPRLRVASGASRAADIALTFTVASGP